VFVCLRVACFIHGTLRSYYRGANQFILRLRSAERCRLTTGHATIGVSEKAFVFRTISRVIPCIARSELSKYVCPSICLSHRGNVSNSHNSFTSVSQSYESFLSEFEVNRFPTFRRDRPSIGGNICTPIIEHSAIYCFSSVLTDPRYQHCVNYFNCAVQR